MAGLDRYFIVIFKAFIPCNSIVTSLSFLKTGKHVYRYFQKRTEPPLQSTYVIIQENINKSKKLYKGEQQVLCKCLQLLISEF